MADKILIPAELRRGAVVVVSVVDLDGSAISERADAAAGPPSLTDAFQSINAFAARLRTELDTAAPDTAKVEFSIGFAMRASKITPVIVDGTSEGSITVTMEWKK